MPPIEFLPNRLELAVSLDTVRHKLGFIQQGASGEELAGLRLALSKVSGGLLTQRSKPTLELDLLYAVLRHRRWLGASIARAVLIAYLVDEHDLTESEALSLVAAAFDFLTPAATEDTGFLRHVVVHCLTAADAAAASLDLGIGDALLSRIKRILTEPASNNSAPALDDAVMQVVAALASQLEGDPDTLEVWRLGDQLHAVGHTSNDTQLRKIFEALLRLGITGELHDDDLIPALSAAQMIEAVAPAGRSKKAAPVWRLSAKGAELTAVAFSRRYGMESDDFTPNAAGISGFCAAYQAAVLTHATEALVNVPLLRTLLSPAAVTQAVVVRAAARRLTIMDASDELNELQAVLASEPSPWRRISICQGIGAAGSRPAVGQLLVRMARSDPSPLVREAALATIHATETITRA